MSKNARTQQGHNKENTDVLRPIRLKKMCDTGDEFQGVHLISHLV